MILNYPRKTYPSIYFRISNKKYCLHISTTELSYFLFFTGNRNRPLGEKYSERPSTSRAQLKIIQVSHVVLLNLQAMAGVSLWTEMTQAKKEKKMGKKYAVYDNWEGNCDFSFPTAKNTVRRKRTKI